jgi:hypothetical protein
MNTTRLAALSQRRAALVEEIAAERDRMSALVTGLRTQLAIAGLALLAGRLMRRSRWLRLLATGGAALAAVLPLLARLVPARR